MKLERWDEMVDSSLERISGRKIVDAATRREVIVDIAGDARGVDEAISILKQSVLRSPHNEQISHPEYLQIISHPLVTHSLHPPSITPPRRSVAHRSTLDSPRKSIGLRSDRTRYGRPPSRARHDEYRGSEGAVHLYDGTVRYSRRSFSNGQNGRDGEFPHSVSTHSLTHLNR